MHLFNEFTFAAEDTILYNLYINKYNKLFKSNQGKRKVKNKNKLQNLS